jgi:hypothetical protein
MATFIGRRSVGRNFREVWYAIAVFRCGGKVFSVGPGRGMAFVMQACPAGPVGEKQVGME